MSKKVYLEDAIHERTVESTEGKKLVFLIGDSMRMGFCETAKKELQDVADVVFPNENCRYSQYIITMLNAWAGICEKEKVDLVQFNCGHWDVAHWAGEDVSLNTLEVYADNIRRIIRCLRRIFPRAKVIFATSTPMNPNGETGVHPRTTAELMAYNEAAVRVAEEEGVKVNDIFAITKDWPSSCYADYAHFTEEYFAVLGKEVAQFIRKELD